MSVAERRVAASILIALQGGVLVLSSFFTLVSGNLAVGRADFVIAFLVCLVSVLVLYDLLPGIIAATALCGAEIVVGGILLLTSVTPYGGLGLLGDLFTVAAPLVLASILAVPTFILLVSLLGRRSNRPPAAR